MKTYPITDNNSETIELQADADSELLALVQKIRLVKKYKITVNTIVLTRREALLLYQALQDSILNKGESK